MNEANIQGLDTLETWRKAIDFAVMVNQDVIPLLPSTEKWNLQDQLRRAGSSVPAHIAEGHERYYFLDNVRFCYDEAEAYLAEDDMPATGATDRHHDSDSAVRSLETILHFP